MVKGHNIGNNPYQNGKDKKFYLKLLKKQSELVKDGHYFAHYVPSAFVKDKFFKELQKDFDFIKINMDVQCFPKIGTPIMSFVAIRKTGNKNNGMNCTYKYVSKNVTREINLQIIKLNNLYNEETTVYEYVSIADKILKDSIKATSGKGDTINKKSGTTYSFDKDDRYKYPAYLTSDPKKCLGYSEKPERGYGEEKLCISDHIIPGESKYYTEFNKDKSVGRYGNYFPVSKEKCYIYEAYLDDDINKFINNLYRSGRFAYIVIPNLDLNNIDVINLDFYSYFIKKNILNKKDVETIKEFVKNNKVKTG